MHGPTILLVRGVKPDSGGFPIDPGKGAPADLKVPLRAARRCFPSPSPRP